MRGAGRHLIRFEVEHDTARSSSGRPRSSSLRRDAFREATWLTAHEMIPAREDTRGRGIRNERYYVPTPPCASLVFAAFRQRPTPRNRSGVGRQEHRAVAQRARIRRRVQRRGRQHAGRRVHRGRAGRRGVHAGHHAGRRPQPDAAARVRGRHVQARRRRRSSTPARRRSAIRDRDRDRSRSDIGAFGGPGAAWDVPTLP
ncbi:MAG: hypothetical protein H6Q90_5456 [Deltaproteobacteria bacterium]|nr:hypothetical protein [Deltaproteobacteria bacterium]